MAKPRGSSWEGTVNFKGKRFRRSFMTEQEASLWELDTQTKLIKGEPIDMGERVAKRKGDLPFTLSELAQHVYDTHWSPMPSGDKQLINAQSIIGIIGANLPIAKLTKADIDKARAKLLADGNAPGTVNRKIAALSRAMTEAEELGIIDRKPKFSRYKESEHRVRRFTDKEEKLVLAFFERISHQDMQDYVVISVDTGMRQGEVLALHHEDAQDGRVTVWGSGANGQRSKSGKSRTVPLTERAKAVLDRRREELGGREVFPNLNKNQVAHYWGRMAETLGLDHDKQFVPHVMRHEFCSRLASKGENAAVIQKLAGHSTMTVTQRYIHLFSDDLDGAIKRMENKPKPSQPNRLEALKEMLSSLSPEELEVIRNFAA